MWGEPFSCLNPCGPLARWYRTTTWNARASAVVLQRHWEPALRFNSLSTAFLGNPRRTAPVHFAHVQWRRFYPKWHSDWDARCKYLLCICLLVSLCFLFYSFFPFGWHIPIFCFIAWRRRQKYVVLEVTSMLSSSHYLLFSQGQWLRGDSGQQSKHLRTGYWA